MKTINEETSLGYVFLENTLPKETTTDDDDDDDDNDDDELFCSDLLNGDWDFISSQQQ